LREWSIISDDRKMQDDIVVTATTAFKQLEV